jgi:hypothetical protein
MIAAAAITARPVGVRDVQPAPTRGTPKQPHQHTATPPDRACRHLSLHLRVVGEKLLVVFVRVPGNIALVMIAQQDKPVRAPPMMPATLVRGPIDDARAGLGPAKGVGPSVDRVLQEVQDRVVVGLPPDHPVAPDRIARDAGQRDLFLVQPQQHLAGAAELGEFLKDQAERPLDPLVRVLLQPPVARLDIPDGQADDELAALGLRGARRVRPLPQPAELGLAHRPLEPEQQPIVELAGIVDAFGVNDQGVEQPAELQQLIPVAVIAGQARDLEAHHGAHPAEAHVGDETLKAGPVGRTGPGLPEILINHNDLAPAQRARMLGQLILTPATLLMMPDLPESGLPNVDDGGAGEMLGADLEVIRHPRPPSPRRQPRDAAARPGARARGRVLPLAPPPTA